MRNPSLAEMVAELQTLLLDSQASLSPLVARAARVAHLSDEPEFAALFELHLDGVPTKDGHSGGRFTKWPDPARQPHWSFLEGCVKDRSMPDGTFKNQPLEVLEELRRKVRQVLDDEA